MRVTLNDIKHIVCEEFGVSLNDLLSLRRQGRVVLPRQYCFWIAKRFTTLSYPQIAKAFGGRDHTTILHGIRKIESLAEISEEARRAVARVESILAEPDPLPQIIDVSEVPSVEMMLFLFSDGAVVTGELPKPPPPPPPPEMPTDSRAIIYVRRKVRPARVISAVKRPRVVTGAFFGDPGYASLRVANNERSADR